MANQTASDKTKATGHFNATNNGSELFNSERVDVWREDKWLVIEGSKRGGFPDGEYFRLTIDPATPSGPRPFVPGEDLTQAFYLDGGRTVYAQRGTFDANLNNSTKKYRITFKLIFTDFDEIQGDVDVSE